jgi:hypothetical protein
MNTITKVMVQFFFLAMYNMGKSRSDATRMWVAPAKVRKLYATNVRMPEMRLAKYDRSALLRVLWRDISI